MTRQKQTFEQDQVVSIIRQALILKQAGEEVETQVLKSNYLHDLNSSDLSSVGISQGDLYSIASEFGIPKKYADQSIESSRWLNPSSKDMADFVRGEKVFAPCNRDFLAIKGAEILFPIRKAILETLNSTFPHLIFIEEVWREWVDSYSNKQSQTIDYFCQDPNLKKRFLLGIPEKEIGGIGLDGVCTYESNCVEYSNRSDYKLGIFKVYVHDPLFFPAIKPIKEAAKELDPVFAFSRSLERRVLEGFLQENLQEA